jgi:hypothetical protein
VGEEAVGTERIYGNYNTKVNQGLVAPIWDSEVFNAEFLASRGDCPSPLGLKVPTNPSGQFMFHKKFFIG